MSSLKWCGWVMVAAFFLFDVMIRLAIDVITSTLQAAGTSVSPTHSSPILAGQHAVTRTLQDDFNLGAAEALKCLLANSDACPPPPS